ncbi:hypothetical protein WME99_51530 [Sorangium sp. So ce136]|uniref:hypothetical protein n=1 Tax=Sorangium sp. So ce136 TaxID=3133284 RepID=UPI003F06E420
MCSTPSRRKRWIVARRGVEDAEVVGAEGGSTERSGSTASSSGSDAVRTFRPSTSRGSSLVTLTALA